MAQQTMGSSFSFAELELVSKDLYEQE